MMPWHPVLQMWRALPLRRRRVVSRVIVLCLMAGIAGGFLATRHLSSTVSLPAVYRAGPPWIYGNVRARYTLIEYADLECPYCKAYFPILKRWVDTHPEVNWQWHHRPLAMHEPAASREARLAECVGRLHGRDGFWHAVAWIYAHTRENGKGVAGPLVFPWNGPRLKDCLDNPAVTSAIDAQARAANRENITATPTLKLVDHRTNRKITLEGTIEGDALLSAIDLLAASSTPLTVPRPRVGRPSGSTIGSSAVIATRKR